MSSNLLGDGDTLQDICVHESIGLGDVDLRLLAACNTKIGALDSLDHDLLTKNLRFLGKWELQG